MAEKCFVRKHDLGSVLGSSFELMKPTWKKTLPFALVCYLPIAIVTGFYMRSYLGALGNIFMMSEYGFNPSILPRFIGFAAWMIIFTAVYTVIAPIVPVVASRNAWAAMNKKAESPTSDNGGTATTADFIKAKLGTSIIANIIVGLITFGISLIFIVLVAVFTILMVAFKNPVSIIVGVLGDLAVYLGFFVAVYVLSSVFQLVSPIIATEDIKAGAAVKRAWELSKGNRPRLTGITFVVLLVFSMISGIVSSPFLIAFMIPYFRFIWSLSSGGGGTNEAMLFIYSMAANSLWLIPYMLIAGTLSTLFTPSVATVLMTDLKVRKGELTDESAAAS